MASLKEQLDAAGFDISGFDEESTLKQLDDAGYDVSSFKTMAVESKPSALSDVLQQSAKQGFTAPFEMAKQAVKYPVQNPEKVVELGTETPLLPMAGAAIGGPIGGVLGEGVRQMGSIAMGKPAPSKLESAASMGLAGLVPSAGKGISAAGTGVKKLSKAMFAPGRKAAGEALAQVEKQAKLVQNVTSTPSATKVKKIVEGLQDVPPEKYTEIVEGYKVVGKQNLQKLKDTYDTAKAAMDVVSPSEMGSKIFSLLRPKALTPAGYARLTAHKQAATEALNALVPGRTAAAEAVANSVRRANILKAAAGVIPGGSYVSSKLSKAKAIKEQLGRIK